MTHVLDYAAHSFLRGAIYRAVWHMPPLLVLAVVVLCCFFLARRYP